MGRESGSRNFVSDGEQNIRDRKRNRGSPWGHKIEVTKFYDPTEQERVGKPVWFFVEEGSELRELWKTVGFQSSLSSLFFISQKTFLHFPEIRCCQFLYLKLLLSFYYH